MIVQDKPAKAQSQRVGDCLTGDSPVQKNIGWLDFGDKAKWAFSALVQRQTHNDGLAQFFFYPHPNLLPEREKGRFDDGIFAETRHFLFDRLLAAFELNSIAINDKFFLEPFRFA